MLFSYNHSELSTLETAEAPCFLTTNGLGGYQSMTAAFSANRCDSGLLISAVTAPNHRVTLVHRLRERLTLDKEDIFLSSQTFHDGTEPEQGWKYLQRFSVDAVPQWEYTYKGVTISRTCGIAFEHNTSAVCYTIHNDTAHTVTLNVQPSLLFILKGWARRSAPVLTFENNRVTGDDLQLYLHSDTGFSAITPHVETLFYQNDKRDGRAEDGKSLLCCETSVSVAARETRTFQVVFSDKPIDGESGFAIVQQNKNRLYAEAEHTGFVDPVAQQLAQAATAFLVRRDSTNGKSMIAGYPLFGDWGRDTMIAMTGCALSTGHTEDVKELLKTFLTYEKDGLIPNLFPEGQTDPMYNTVDAALLVVNAVWLYYQRTQDVAFVRSVWDRLAHIVQCYHDGTHYSIHMDTDSLIYAGEGKYQLTWMDAYVDGFLPTPRHGKPVEINAYWYSALRVMEKLSPLVNKDGDVYRTLAEKVQHSFLQKFWSTQNHCLKDLLSGEAVDNQIRCNQIWALTMPFTMLNAEQERQVLDTVYHHLWTAHGLRTLSPTDPDFHPFYGGTQYERDLAYHQGTVWAFPLGAFYLAWLRVYPETGAAQVRQWLEPMTDILREGCVGQISEIYDGGTPSISKGCYAQAWSVGELLRVYEALEA